MNDIVVPLGAVRRWSSIQSVHRFAEKSVLVLLDSGPMRDVLGSARRMCNKDQ